MPKPDITATQALDWLNEHGMFQGGTTEYASDCLRIVREERVDLLAALEHYAACGDGCTCGDGWSHDVALAAIAKAKPKEK